MNESQFVASRDKRMEYMRLYYQSNKEKWIRYKEKRKQKLLDERPVIVFY